jgi:hypothetical protein
MKREHEILIREPEKNRPLGDIHLSQERVLPWALVDTVISLWFHRNSAAWK